MEGEMRIALSGATALLIGFLAAPGAVGQGPDGFAQIYSEPTNVNLGGRWVVADIALYADMAAAERDDLRLALVTDVTKFIDETENDLRNWIATHQERCGNRWGAGEPLIEFPEGAIRFALELELEVWNCGWNGNGEPGRLTRETGTVDVTLQPFILGGRLQARLRAFSITGREGYSKYLPLESLARMMLDNELGKLNENRKFHQAPEPLNGEGFSYRNIEAEVDESGRVVITASYRTKGPPEKFDRVIEKLRKNGLTQ
jgi:hypothetical protein